MAVHGTLSLRLRKGVKGQVNGGTVFEDPALLLGEEFVRVSEDTDEGALNTCYDWAGIDNVRAISQKD